MVIGLGCEKLQPERLLQGTEDVQAIAVDDASIVRLQDEQHVGFRFHGGRYSARWPNAIWKN
ncbi:D-galactarate dehydrogenase [Atlantibacter hermannii]|nr:D-galactarate dehydrogenase [Atlantibacter hermannii]